MSSDVAVLLPSAKTMHEPPAESTAWADAIEGHPLAAQRREVMDAVAAAADELAATAWANLVDAPNDDVTAETQSLARELHAAPTMPAADLFDGPVARRLDVATLTAPQRRTVWFVTAAAGLSRGDEPVPALRLAIGKSLEPLGKLSTWWRPHLTARLRDELSSSDELSSNAVVWDLLGNEHAAAIALPDGLRRVETTFVRADGRNAPGAVAKQLRGLIARHVAQSSATEPSEALKGFSHEVAGTVWAVGDITATDAGFDVQIRGN